MASINHVTLLGNLTADPELRHTARNVSVCNFSIAVNNKTATGEVVTFIPVLVWGLQAERVAQYKKKGDPVTVEGHLRTDTWTAKEGDHRSRLEVVADRVQFLSRGHTGTPHPEPVQEAERIF